MVLATFLAAVYRLGVFWVVARVVPWTLITVGEGDADTGFSLLCVKGTVTLESRYYA